MMQNDIYPALTATLSNNGSPVDLSLATSVKFTMSTPAGTVIINKAAATIVNALEGTVRYAWQASDTATPGRYFAEFEVAFASGGTMTFPNTNHDTIEIQKQLA
jgi:hypothetical protein